MDFNSMPAHPDSWRMSVSSAATCCPGTSVFWSCSSVWLHTGYHQYARNLNPAESRSNKRSNNCAVVTPARQIFLEIDQTMVWRSSLHFTRIYITIGIYQLIPIKNLLLISYQLKFLRWSWKAYQYRFKFFPSHAFCVPKAHGSRTLKSTLDVWAL